MNKVDALIEDTYAKYMEWLEMLDEIPAYNFMLNALASELVKEREASERYKMALKRCELTKHEGNRTTAEQ